MELEWTLCSKKEAQQDMFDATYEGDALSFL